MNNEKKILGIVIGVVLGGFVMTAQAAVLNNGDLLTITNGIPAYDAYGNQFGVASGSYFSMELHSNDKLIDGHMYSVIAGTDGGIRIGATQPPGAIDSESDFFGGSTITEHYTTSPVTGGTTNGLDFSGWSIYWWGISTSLGSGAWTPLNCASQNVPCTGYSNGVAVFSWSGIYGDTYTLDYAARVPNGDPSSFGGVQYFLHLEGTVQAVPVPAAAWLFGSGLLGLMGVVRRKQC